MVNYSTTALDATFGALSDPTRRAILARLAQGEAKVTELAEPFQMSLPAISKHLRVLESAGLLRREIDGRVHRCRLDADPMKNAAAWIVQYRAFWESQFDALEKFLQETTNEETTPWPPHNNPKEHNNPRENPNSRSKSAVPSRPRAKKSSAPGPIPSK
jgi:DNA-binding transcriptional ArsR family regulator